MMNNKIGVQVVYNKSVNLLEKFKTALAMDISSCQLCIWDESMFTDEYAKIVNDAVAETGFEITTVWAGWGGPASGTLHTDPLPSVLFLPLTATLA